MATMASGSGAVTPATNSYRILQLVLGILCMVMVANLQYGWTLFVNPMDDKFHWGRPAIQVAFSLFVLAETWLVPFEGWMIDRWGMRIMILVGGVAAGLGWVMNSYVDNLPMLYVAQIIGGIGAGIVYGGCVGNALKWFPDHRGLAAGLTAAGFGAGAAITVIPIANMIKGAGYQQAFLYFGLGQGIIVILLALVVRAPKEGEVSLPPAPKVQQAVKDSAPMQTLKAPAFWVMYVMFVLVGAGGLMAVAQLAPYARDLKIDQTPVNLVGITLPALVFALSIDRILNGICRPFFGWVSDHIGRENTMFIAFLAEGLGILVLWQLAANPVLFVILTGVVFFAWGEIYSLFPATSADLFGRKFATVNYGMLYTAKGTASLLVPIGALIVKNTGSWSIVLVVAAIFNLIAAVMALAVLKPMRIKAFQAAR